MSVEACAEIVRKGDSDRFLAAMAAPVPARAALFPLYAFNVEIARAPFVSAEPMIGEMRLQWWRDAVAEIAAGQRPRAHEVVAPLAEVMRGRDLPVALFDEMAEARRWDLFSDPFDGPDDLRRHLDRTAGHLMWLSSRALGGTDEAGARAVGLAQGLAAWLRAVPELEARGRHPWPDGAEALIGPALDGLRAARAPGPAAPAWRAAWLAGPVLRQAQADPGRIRSGALGVSEFRRRTGLARRAATGGW
ncbi:phytoene/squalene synthase family protein [Wenxinia saemankumensis]|uniref:Phytoene/squalene synthetase n=1 Tax=Wenxinia saemankumensis TaxID=1447782 RepID=A0A1M5ZZC8_9RHOB|nr:squalene/phytoene synthase family protein [Wenxinia saemankumensis]SHI29580.1 Phytoene/squalene synthetase [Wenxinia saemankumensis]